MKRFKVIMEHNARGETIASTHEVKAVSPRAALGQVLKLDGFYRMADIQEFKARKHGIWSFWAEEAQGYVVGL